MPEHPCKNCPRANQEFVADLEYGCFDPCDAAEDYFADIGKRIDELLKQVEELLTREETRNDR